MGTKKTGRPTDDPKATLIHIRMSDNDLEKLEYCAKQTGMSKSEIIRRGIDKVYQEIKK